MFYNIDTTIIIFAINKNLVCTELHNMSDTLEYMLNCLNTIVDGQRITVYVAIGPASHMKIQDPNTHEWSIEPKYDQQYPMFLKSLKKKCPNDPIHIFLIDPLLEKVPFIVCNKKNELDDHFVFDPERKAYHNNQTNITVYPINEYVSYPGDGRYHNENQCVDLTTFFDTLNELAIERHWLVFGQDYTGRNIANINKYYSNVLKNHYDHIIYGIADGMDGGCYIDLSLPICDFEYVVYPHYVRIFGIRNFDSLKEFLDSKQQLYEITGTHNSPILNEQIKQYIDNKQKFILYNIIGLLRQLQAKIIGRDVDISLEYILSIENNCNVACDINLRGLINTQKLDQAFDIIKLSILPTELEKLLYHKYTDVTIYKIEEFMHHVFAEKDPYKWNDIARNILMNEMLY